MVEPVIEFGRIDWTADKVLIVATGPSSSGFSIKRSQLPGVHILAVKNALFACEAHSWITVDPNVRARPLMASQRHDVKYMAAVPDDYGRSDARLAIHRDPPESNVLYLKRIIGNGVLKSRKCLSENPGAIHTGNSAWGALGAAYLMKAKKIGFIGLDATSHPHGIGKGAPKGSLAHLPDLFASALPQLQSNKVEIMNGSLASRVRCFNCCSRQELLHWISK